MENQMGTLKPTKSKESKPAIGKWQIGDGDNFISFALTEKPNWFRRKMANYFFGLVWYDFKSPIDVKDIKPSKGIKAKVTKEVPKGRR